MWLGTPDLDQCSQICPIDPYCAHFECLHTWFNSSAHFGDYKIKWCIKFKVKNLAELFVEMVHWHLASTEFTWTNNFVITTSQPVNTNFPGGPECKCHIGCFQYGRHPNVQWWRASRTCLETTDLDKAIEMCHTHQVHGSIQNKIVQ